MRIALAMLLGFRLGGGELGARHRAHLGVESGIGQHRRQIRALLLLGAEGPDRRDDRLELAELARERRIFGAGDAFRQARADLLVTAQDEIEIVVGGHFRDPKGERRTRALGARGAR